MLVLLLIPTNVQAQQKMTLSDLIERAKKNNPDLNLINIDINQAKMMTKTAYNLDKTEFNYAYDPTNVDENNGAPYKQFSVSQSFKFPSYYAAKKQMLVAEYKKQEQIKKIEFVKIEKEIHQAYQQLLYLSAKKKNLKFLDSLYAKFYKSAQRKYQLGESNVLEKLTAQSKSRKIALSLSKIENEIQQLYQTIKLLIGLSDKDRLNIAIIPLKPLKSQAVNVNETAGMAYFKGEIVRKKSLLKTQKRSMLPDFSFGYTYGNTLLQQGNSYNAYQFGISIPIFSGSRTKTKTALLALERSTVLAENIAEKLRNKLSKLRLTQQNAEQNLQYFENEGRQLSKQIYQTADKSFKAGEINYFQYIQALENAKEIENEYLENLLRYNLNVLEINYLTDD